MGGYTAVKLDGHQMGVGDMSICCGCEALMRYVGEPIGFKLLEGDELIEVRAHPDMRLAQRVVRRVKIKLELEKQLNASVRFLSDDIAIAFPNRQQRRAAERRRRD